MWSNIGTILFDYDIKDSIMGKVIEKSIDPKGNETVKTFDSSGRLEKVVSGNDVTIYSYYLDGSKKSVTYYKLLREPSSKGYSQEYSYNKDGTISSLTNRKPDGTPMDVTYYDYEKGNMKTRRELKNGVYSYTGYTYDALNRLTQVTEPDGKSTYYEYDAAGNRTKENVMIIYGGMDSFYSKETNYCYNSQNWLTNTTTWEYDYINYTNKSKYVYYSYDNNGNQLSTFVEEYCGEGSSNSYDSMYNEYDLRNQLVCTRTAEGTEVRSTYNGEGYRVAKSVKAPGEAQGKITYYLYEGDKVILELDSNRNQTGRNVYGTNLLFRTVGNRNSGTTYSYIYNGHGDVTALITDAGYVAATYRYDAFGNLTVSTGNVDNSIRYAGYQYDVETGLYYINARMYDPLTARFLQEDTYTGNPNDPLSLNLYTYCHNDPVSYDDPTGHKRKNIVQKWVAKAKKAVKKTVEKVASTAKKAVSAAKKEIKKTIAKEKARSKEAAKQYEKKAATVKVPIGKVDAKPNNYLEGGTGPQKTKTVQAKLEKTTLVDGIQTLLDAVGLVPGYGEPCDLLNAEIYLLRGDKANAALSYGASLPIGGQLATIGKFINKGAKAADKADDVYDVVKAADKVADKGGTASKWVDDAGKTIWPPNNGAVAGTEKMINLNKGTTFGRIGGDTGSFVAPPKTSPDNLSLAPETDISNYTEYIATKPISGVEKAIVAPWFDKPGGGTQFKLPMTIRELIREGYIAPK